MVHKRWYTCKVAICMLHQLNCTYIPNVRIDINACILRHQNKVCIMETCRYVCSIDHRLSGNALLLYINYYFVIIILPLSIPRRQKMYHGETTPTNWPVPERFHKK